MAEDGRADRPADEADEEYAKASSTPTIGSDFGKNSLPNTSAGHCAVEQEVVPLDGCADSAGDHGATQLCFVFDFGKSAGGAGGGC